MQKLGYGRALAILAIFIAIGPPVGALSFSVLGGVGAWLTGQPSGMAAMIFYGGLLALPLSWFVGGIQAAVAGVATVLYGAFTSRISMPVATAAGFACGMIYVLREEPYPAFAALTLAAHLLAALACVLIARTLR